MIVSISWDIVRKGYITLLQLVVVVPITKISVSDYFHYSVLVYFLMP